jgi:hypothetical protein
VLIAHLNMALLSAHMNILPVASGLVALILFAVSWRFRLSVLQRRERRPLALMVSDAISAGSFPSRMMVQPTGSTMENLSTHRMSPALSSPEKLNATGNQWGFSIHDHDKVIFTFVYPGKAEARIAYKAMQRAFKELAYSMVE